MDDKLFSFWHLQAEAYPFSHVKGIYRFETGIKVNEFRDLRANPRCLLESQILSFRVRYARMRGSNLFFPANRAGPQTFGGPGSGLGLNFDPYSTSPLPRRVIAIGAAANFPSIVNLLGDVFNAPIFVPSTQLDSAHAVAPTVPMPGAPAVPTEAVAKFAAAHRNAPAPGCTSRAALGGAYLARWVWGRERSQHTSGALTFEDEIRRLLARRYNATVGLAQRKQGSSGSGTPSPAPYLQHPRSSLGASVLVEEEEEEEEEPTGMSNGTPNYTTTPPPRIRTTTGSSMTTLSTSGLTTPGGSSALTSLTSPDTSLNYGMNGGGLSPTVAATTPTDATSGAPTTGITPLTPVSALPTADAEAQIGWMKVADPDVDAFMAYASIVPEFVRLEGLLIKSLV